MNKRFFLITFAFLTIILMPALFSKVGYLQSVQQGMDDAKSFKACGVTVEGLRLCTPSSKIEVNSGDSYVIKLLLVNTTDREIKVRANRDPSNFEVKLLSSNGEFIQ